MSHLREILHQPTVVLVGWSLVHFLWQGVIVALVVASIFRASRHARAETRYAVAGIGLLTMLACPILTFVAISQGGYGFSSDLGDRPGFVQPVSASGGDADPALFAPTAILEKIASLPRELPAERLIPFLVAIWGVGVALLAIRLVLGWLRISFVRTTAVPVTNHVFGTRLADLCKRMGIQRPVVLLESALAPGPAVIGVLRPAILFPAAALTGLWPIQIEAILAHELAHIRRHDYLVNLLQSIVETLLFYHPAVWWVSRRIRQEREHCCDDLAVQACGDRRFYANCLADLDELRAAPIPLAIGAAGSGLLPRIRRILSLPGGENRAASAAAGTLVVAATGTAIMFLAAAPVARASRDVKLTPALELTRPAIKVPTKTDESVVSRAAIQNSPEATPADDTSTRDPKVAQTTVSDAHSSTTANESDRDDGYTPRPSVGPATTPNPRRVSSPQQAAHSPAVTDFPPVSPQLENALRARTAVTLPPPTPATPQTTPTIPNIPTPANTRKPRIINYNGLLFVPDNFVLPRDPNFVIPQDIDYIAPQDANYIIPARNYSVPDRNYLIPDRNYVAPRGQSSAGAGR